jgi:hypothetical protein
MRRSCSTGLSRIGRPGAAIRDAERALELRPCDEETLALLSEISAGT